MKPAERAVLLGLLTALALGLRLWFVTTGRVDGPLRADAGQYAQCAANLLAHGTFSVSTAVPPPPDSLRSPGYPLFLAGVRAVAADDWLPWALRLQALLSAALVPLTFWLARRTLPFAAAFAAATAVALSPHLIAATGVALTEALTAVTLTAACWLLARAATPNPHAVRRAAVAGAAFGATALLNEGLAPLPWLLALLLRRDLGGRAALTLALAAAAPIGAWQLRNATTELADTAGHRAIATLSHGSYPDLFFATEQHRNYPYREDPEQPAISASWSRLGDVLAGRVAAAPWRYARWYLLDKPRWLWRWDLVQGNGDVHVYPVRDSILREQPVVAALTATQRWLHPVFVLLSLCGLWLYARRGGAGATAPGLRAAATALLFATALYSLFLPDPRYLVPLRPLQAALAAAAATAVWRRWAAYRGQDLGVRRAPPMLPAP